MLKILLYQPLIPYNTGNIIRLCSNVGATLHLIHPLGFSLEDKLLKRAGLDYIDLSIIREYSSLEEYLDENDASRIFATTSKAKKVYSDINYKVGDTLLFGPEDLGLPKDIYKKIRNSIRIPMQPNNRSLNLSNSVAIVAYEAWRQLNFCE
jgi:tRNA (cytidine/uridine-2'-O-)-methyltransferase|tara:strand:- start:376 stop:828 length:453 start_codon:yes stop_codon:yes gene_type:complete